jgi:AsmA protein
MQGRGTDVAGSAKKAAARRHWLKIAGIVVAVVILVIIIVPFFVNANAFRPMLESRMSAALGRKVTLGNLSFSLWTGSLVADNVAVADDPAFSSTPFLQAKSLHIGVDTGALLFHHAVNIRKFVASSPEIHLISNQNGKWNYASLGGGSSSANQQSASPNVTVGVAKVENGSVVVSSTPATGKPFVYSDVNITVENVSYTQAMPFNVSAKLPGDGSVKLNGTAGPLNRQDMTATPLKASLEVKHFDPVKAGVLPASEGVSMVADITAQADSDGRTLASTGKTHAVNLLLSRSGSPAPKPVDLDYAVSYDLQSRAGQVRDVAVHTGDVVAHMTGGFKMQGQEVALDLHLAAPNLPVDGVEELLPAVGIRLPSGSSLKGGTITANLAITGTAKAPDIKGPVEVDNTQLAGFDLGSKIQGLKALGGTGGGTGIRKLSTDVHSTVPSTDLTNIFADVPAIGTATGNGTVSAAGALDFHLTAKLNQASAVGGVISGAASALGGLAGNLLHSTLTNGVPLTITGNTSNPIIRADVGAMLKGNVAGKGTQQQKQSVGSVIKGLLGPK